MKRTPAIFPFLAVGILFLRTSTHPQNTATPLQASSGPRYSLGEIIRLPGVPNAARVDEHLYRGAQPRDAGLRELQRIGITTVVDLRDEEKSKITWEQKTTESLGMRFVNIPVNGWAPPSDQQVALFLAIFRAQPRDKVFVHCQFGDDRTGVFVATYRIAFDKFPVSAAQEEMDRFGFNRNWHRNMSVYVREFPAHLASAPALTDFK